MIRYEVVEACTLNDPNRSEAVKDAIEKGGLKGWKFVALNPMFDVIQIVWEKPAVERRKEGDART